MFKINRSFTRDVNLPDPHGPPPHANTRPNPDPTQIASQIHSAGFAVLENYIDAAELACAQDFVFSTVKKNRDNCVIYRGPKEEMAGTFMCDDLPKKPEFVKLCHDVYEAGTGRKARNLIAIKYYAVCLARLGGRIPCGFISIATCWQR